MFTLPRSRVVASSVFVVMVGCSIWVTVISGARPAGASVSCVVGVAHNFARMTAAVVVFYLSLRRWLMKCCIWLFVACVAYRAKEPIAETVAIKLAAHCG